MEEKRKKMEIDLKIKKEKQKKKDAIMRAKKALRDKLNADVEKRKQAAMEE